MRRNGSCPVWSGGKDRGACIRVLPINYLPGFSNTPFFPVVLEFSLDSGGICVYNKKENKINPYREWWRERPDETRQPARVF